MATNLTPDEADFLCDLLVAMGSSYLHLESTYNRNGDEVFFGVTYDEEGEHYIKIKDFIREIYDDMMCLSPWKTRVGLLTGTPLLIISGCLNWSFEKTMMKMITMRTRNKPLFV